MQHLKRDLKYFSRIGHHLHCAQMRETLLWMYGDNIRKALHCIFASARSTESNIVTRGIVHTLTTEEKPRTISIFLFLPKRKAVMLDDIFMKVRTDQ